MQIENTLFVFDVLVSCFYSFSTSQTNLPNVQMVAGTMMMIPCFKLFAFFRSRL